jgi:DedD protein
MRAIVEEEEREGTDTEITLGMKSLLGVFFGAVVVCGVFFGFGYSLGRSSAHPAAGPNNTSLASPAVAVAPSGDQDSTPNSADSSTGSSPLKTVVSDDQSTAQSKPAASAANDTQYEYVPTPDGPARRPINAPPKAQSQTQSQAQSQAKTAATAAPPAYTKPSAAIARVPAAQEQTLTPAPEPAALTTTRNANPPAAQPVSTSQSESGSTMVQIAAVTHQEDANILVSALKKRGYTVIVRSDAKDSLLHVQIGPFASRDEARAMRARLLADGYNAILK